MKRTALIAAVMLTCGITTPVSAAAQSNIARDRLELVQKTCPTETRTMTVADMEQLGITKLTPSQFASKIGELCGEERQVAQDDPQDLEQRAPADQYAAYRTNGAPRYHADRVLDSLGPNGRVMPRIRDPRQLPAHLQSCGEIVRARGVIGFAVSQRCLRTRGAAGPRY